MRIDPHQPWHPVYLLQPFYNVLLMALFEWGVAVPRPRPRRRSARGEKSKKEVLEELKGIAGKARAQIVKDYIAWPLLSALRGRRRPRWPRSARATGGPARGKALGGSSAAAPTRTDVARDSGWPAAARRDDLPRTLAANADRQHGPQRVVATRSSSAATSPTRRTRSARRRPRTRRRGALVRAPADRRGQHRGRRRCSTSISGNLGYQVEHHLYPGHAEHPLRARSRRGCARSASATSCRTTRARSRSSWGWCSARSCGWPSRAASRGPSRARTTGATTTRRPRRPSTTAVLWSGRGGVVLAASTSRRNRDGQHGGSQPRPG